MAVHIVIAVAGAMVGAILGVVVMGALMMGSHDEDQARENLLRLAMLGLIVACEDYVSDTAVSRAVGMAREALGQDGQARTGQGRTIGGREIVARG